MTKMNNHRKERAASMMKACGYASGGAVDKTDGEPDMDPIAPAPKKKANGGKACMATGGAAKARLDKPKRYATGGAIDGPPKKSSAKTQVNIVIAGKGGADAPPAAPPMPMPVPVARPPMGGPPPGAMPPPAPPMKRGGVVKGYDAGAGGGEGRLEKAANYKARRRGSRT